MAEDCQILFYISFKLLEGFNSHFGTIKCQKCRRNRLVPSFILYSLQVVIPILAVLKKDFDVPQKNRIFACFLPLLNDFECPLQIFLDSF